MNEKVCTDIQKSMDGLLSAGEDDARMDGVLDHIEACTDCAAHFETLNRLRTEPAFDEPEHAEFLAMRRAVLREIRNEPEPAGSFVDRIRTLFAQPTFALGLGVLMLVAGFLAGNRASSVRWPEPSSQGMTIADSSENDIVQGIQLVAAQHTQFEDVINAPIEYANVRVSDEGAGRVGLSFDVSRHIDVVVDKNDPMVSEVLVQSLLSDSSVGDKLKAISATDAMDAKVKEALIRTMLNDENLGVRLRAQGRLVSLSGDRDVELALLGVLKAEDSVQMRLIAIDYLTEGNVQPELVRDAIFGEDEMPRVDAVYVRAMQYVNESD